MQKVIIIGAGPAGITAGYELIKRSPDFEVIILEKSNSIGGIARTIYHNGNRMDIGGHRFFSKSERVNKWWEEIMPMQGELAWDYKKLGRSIATSENGPNPDLEDRVMLMRNRVSRIYYKNKFFDYPIKMSFKTIKNMGILTTFIAGLSYLKSCIIRRPENSLENFFINRFGKKLYSIFFESYTEKLWGRHPRDISADWGGQRIKGLSIIAILKDIFRKIFATKPTKDQVETSLIEEFAYPKLGPGQLWECAAADFIKMGQYDGNSSSETKKTRSQIIMNAEVINIHNQKDRITALTYRDQDGKEHLIDGDIFISSMPIKDLVAGIHEVPENIANIAQNLPYRDFVTVGILVNKLQLQNDTDIKTLNNIIPDNWIYVQDAEVNLGRIQIFNNWSPYMIKDPENTIWIGLEYFCSEGDHLWNMDNEEWKNLGVKELNHMGILKPDTQILDYHCEKVPKAYPAYFDSYKDIDKLVTYLDGYHNLYCTGRNGQHRYNNQDHSMETSFLIVDNILTGRTNKENIWKVNTEKSYHEKK